MTRATFLLVALLGWAGASSTALAGPSQVSLSSELQQVAGYTSAQRAALVDDTLKLLVGGVAEVTKLQDNAKKQGVTDEALTCLATKIASLNALKTQVGQVKGELEVPGLSDSARNHKLFQVVSAKNSGQKLISEAYTCSGEQTSTDAAGSLTVDAPALGEFDGYPDDDFQNISDLPGPPAEETPAEGGSFSFSTRTTGQSKK